LAQANFKPIDNYWPNLASHRQLEVVLLITDCLSISVQRPAVVWGLKGTHPSEDEASLRVELRCTSLQALPARPSPPIARQG